MVTTGPRQEIYLPETSKGELVNFYDFLSTYEAAGNGRFVLRYQYAGSDVGEEVELPAEAFRVLYQVMETMNRGLAVTVLPQQQTVTTQQAAELLDMSRPTVIRLLETEQIPHHRVGTHRRIVLSDVLAYRAQQRRSL